MLGETGEDALTERLRACSREEAELQARLRTAGEAVTEAEVRVAHLGERRGEAAAELERIATTLGRESLAPPPSRSTTRSGTEIEVKLDRVARRREQLGPVNPLAEREYEQALEHVESLETQRADLETALSELQGLIRETDRKIARGLRGDLRGDPAATSRSWSSICSRAAAGACGWSTTAAGPSRCSGGAEESAEPVPRPTPASPDAKRRRCRAVTPRTSSLRRASRSRSRPAGKATRRLSLLSGGEKALVALAFVFAVFLARPSPFYILDEVEAALDDANIDRFLQLVDRFSDRAQFIIVTHQKRTMDAADVLYGVSMGKGGVTKVVSRQFEDAARAAAARRGDRGGLSTLPLRDGVGGADPERGRPAARRRGRRPRSRGEPGALRACASGSRRAARRCAPSSRRASSTRSTRRRGSGSRRR